MKNINLITIIAISVLTMAPSVNATSLKVGTGGSTGNYYSMGKDINSYCSEDVSTPLIIEESGGSIDNLIGMMNKKYSIGMVQEDVLNYNAKRTPKKVNRNRIKVIIGLHEEAVHLLIPKGYKPKSNDQGLWDKFFNNDKTPNTFKLSMLKNQRVGSKGGSMVSAEALSYFFKLGLKVYDAPLDVNDLSTPIILVGGAPYDPVKKYLDSGKWKLAKLDYKTISETAGFYSDINVNYQIEGKVRSVATVGVRALLVGKSFRKTSRNKPMTELATCIYANVADLADDPDTNPNWGNVFDYIEDGGQSDWAYFPLDEKQLTEEENK